MCTPELMGNMIAGVMVAANPKGQPSSQGGNIQYDPRDIHKNVLATLFAQMQKGTKGTPKGLGSSGSGSSNMGLLASMFGGLGSSGVNRGGGVFYNNSGGGGASPTKILHPPTSTV